MYRQGLTAILTAGVLASGCSANGEPKEDLDVQPCTDSRETNVVPTYLESEPNYNRSTDPTILAEIDRTKALEPDSKAKDYGIGNIVCSKVISRGSTFSRPATQQVLTKHAVLLARQMQEAEKSE